MITEQEIEEKKTASGGWTRETLAGWGVPWPPPRGWRKALIAGRAVAGTGIACPRCNLPTEERVHASITEKMLRQPFYYRRWFYCTNKTCKTTMIMRDEDRVFPHENGVLWTETAEIPIR
jgi:hypothetical protein